MSWHDPLPVCDGMAPMVWTHPHHPIQSYNTVRVHSLSLTMSLSLSLVPESFSVSISLRLSLRLSVCRATAGDALWHLPFHTQKQSTAAVHFYFLSLSFPCLGPRLSPRLSHSVHAVIPTANILTSLPSCSVSRMPTRPQAPCTVAGTVAGAALTTHSAVPDQDPDKGPRPKGRRLGCAGLCGRGLGVPVRDYVGVGVGVWMN